MLNPFLYQQRLAPVRPERVDLEAPRLLFRPQCSTSASEPAGPRPPASPLPFAGPAILRRIPR